MSIPTGLATVAGSVAVVVAAALGALLTQLASTRRERIERDYGRRRVALLDAQDVALVVRNRLAEFGRLAGREPGEPSPALSQAQAAMSDALAALDVRLTRVEDASVVAAVTAWRERAEFGAISVEDVTADEVRRLWTAMHQQFGEALRSESLSGAKR